MGYGFLVFVKVETKLVIPFHSSAWSLCYLHLHTPARALAEEEETHKRNRATDLGSQAVLSFLHLWNLL